MAKKRANASKKSMALKKKTAKKVSANNSFKKYQWMLLGAFTGAAVCFYFILTK